MDESDAAYAVLQDLEQTLTGVRGRLADLLQLVGTGVQADAPPDLLAPDLLPTADELCGQPDPQGVPEPLVLPASVDAPPVVLPAEPGEELSPDREHAMSGGAAPPQP